MRRLLASLPPGTLDRAAAATAAHLGPLESLRWDSLLLYRELPGEIPSGHLRAWALGLGKRVYAPRTRGKTMIFLRDSENETTRDGLGFRAPPEDAEEWDGGAALLVAPALAADRSGLRLGRGGGFFDRFLAERRNVVSVLHVLDVQVVEALPADPWDRRFHALLTPTGLSFLDQTPRCEYP